MWFLLRSTGVFEKFLKISSSMCCIIQNYFANFAVRKMDIVIFRGSSLILMRGQEDN